MKKLFILLSLLATVYSSHSQSSTDRITYVVTGTGFNSTELPVMGVTQGVSNLGVTFSGSVSKSSFSDFILTKKPDINSKNFNIQSISSNQPATIEIKYYTSGSATPYRSYRLKNVLLTGFKTTVGGAGATFMENWSFTYSDYGFKDWVNNTSFNYNIPTAVLSAY
jgi:type VI protein secretion system component Hcp